MTENYCVPSSLIPGPVFLAEAWSRFLTSSFFEPAKAGELEAFLGSLVLLVTRSPATCCKVLFSGTGQSPAVTRGLAQLLDGLNYEIVETFPKL